MVSFWALITLAVVAAFNLFALDALMKMRSDITAIRKATVPGGGENRKDPPGAGSKAASILANAVKAVMPTVATDAKDADKNKNTNTTINKKAV